MQPKYRFPEFSGDWISCTAGDILKERKTKQKITEDAPLLAFAAGQGVIDRSERKTNNRDFLTNDMDSKVYLLTEIDDIVYNPANLKYGAIDRNTHGRGVISPIYVTFTTSELPKFVELIVKGDSFQKEALKYEEGSVIKLKSVKPADFRRVSITLPPTRAEQEKIATLFDLIDSRITEQDAKVNNLEKQKQSILQQLFSQQSRLSNFDTDWTQTTLKECIYQVSEKNKGNKNTNVYSVSNKEGFITQNEQFGRELASEDRSNYKIVKKDDFAYNPARINVGSIARLKKDDSGIVSPMYVCFHCNDCITPAFLEYFLQTTIFKNEMLPKLEGGVRQCLNFEAMQEIHISLPKINEQIAIADFIQKLDERIILSRQTLELLKTLRKGLRQQMFA